MGGRNPAPTRRRSAAEWKREIAAWRKSDLAASDYAAKLGVSVSTLHWWRWRLRGGELPDPGDAELRLLPLETARNDSFANGDGVSWELRTTDGSVLRVEGPLTEAQLERLLRALDLPGSGRRG